MNGEEKLTTCAMIEMPCCGNKQLLNENQVVFNDDSVTLLVVVSCCRCGEEFSVGEEIPNPHEDIVS